MDEKDNFGCVPFNWIHQGYRMVGWERQKYDLTAFEQRNSLVSWCGDGFRFGWMDRLWWCFNFIVTLPIFGRIHLININFDRLSSLYLGPIFLININFDRLSSIYFRLDDSKVSPDCPKGKPPDFNCRFLQYQKETWLSKKHSDIMQTDKRDFID